MEYLESDYKEENLDTLESIWGPRKEYIDGELWVIRNFLSQEEIDWLMEEANDPAGWYDTMSSPYGKIRKNKWLAYVPKYDDNGILLMPTDSEDDEYDEDSLWYKYPINTRLVAVMAKEFQGAGAFQSFASVPDEQIIAELGHNVEYAMDWHYELDAEAHGLPEGFEPPKMTAAMSLYINDDFGGGALQFKHKDYEIKPEPGLLINIPLTEEFTHRVAKVTSGIRHTLYGKSYEDLSARHVSSNADC